NARRSLRINQNRKRETSQPKHQTKESRHGSYCEAARIARGQLSSNASTKIFTSLYFLLAWLRGTCILRIVNSLHPGAGSELRLRLTPTTPGSHVRRTRLRIERIAIPRPSRFPRPSHGEKTCREADPLAARRRHILHGV